MSCALSQKMDPKTDICAGFWWALALRMRSLGHRFARKGAVDPWYHYGAMLMAIPAWSFGTAIGIVAGNILPTAVVSALGVALYGMFLAIIIPPARENKVIAGVIVVSFLASFLATHIGMLANLSGSMRTILLTVVITAVGAVLFPVKETGKEETTDES